LDDTFEVGIILTGLDGLAELVGGVLLLLVSPDTINRVVTRVTQHELSQDPNDYIATHLLRYAHGLTGAAVTYAATTCLCTESSR
jgi:uncharacterized membrane protein